MARFVSLEILPGARGQSIWVDLKQELAVADTVEVVKHVREDGEVELELRVWFGTRRDGSNAPGAIRGRSY